MSDSAKPISKAEFANLMAEMQLLPGTSPVAVAVSGGADSMALARLVADWGPARYVTVDHAIRKESAAEAVQVGEWLTDLGLDHTILKVRDPAPTSGIQEWAREQRYTLMEVWCRGQGLENLMIAHHRDDQAETFLLRLFRGSGVDGLAAMDHVTPPLFVDNGPRHVRPLLSIGGDRLRATLRALGQEWIDDPSNDDTAFARVRARHLLPRLAEEGLTSERMARTARRMRRARQALEAATDNSLAKLHEGHAAGFGFLRRPGLGDLPEELGLRLIAKLLMAYGGGGYPLREEKIERLWWALLAAGFRGATLGGVQIQAVAKDRLLFCREAQTVGAPTRLPSGGSGIWDRRFLVSNSGGADIEVGALGPPSEVPELDDAAREVLTAFPSPVRSLVPAFRDNGRLVAVPHIGFGSDNHCKATFAVGRPLPGVTNL